MEHGQPVIQRYPTVTPANAARIAALVVAARNWNKSIARTPDRFSEKNDEALQILLAAAEAID